MESDNSMRDTTGMKSKTNEIIKEAISEGMVSGNINDTRPTLTNSVSCVSFHITTKHDIYSIYFTEIL